MLHLGWKPVTCIAVHRRSESWLMENKSKRLLQVRHRFDLPWDESEGLFARLAKMQSVAKSCRHLETIHSVGRWKTCLELWTSVHDVEGLSVRDYRGRLDKETLLTVMAQTAVALDALHGAGLVHGNVEPANIVWDGLCAVALRAGHLTVLDLAPEGAVGYLAPECFNGAPMSGASDQFQLAITYIELVTGGNPLIPNDWRVLSGQLSISLDDLPDDDAAVLSRALHVDPAQRWPSASAMVQALADSAGVTPRFIDPAAQSVGNEDEAVKEQLRLGAYRELFAGTTRPGSGQVDDFVTFVAGKHSWYKHLPLTPPGSLFTFFLDPCAGTQWVTDADGVEGPADIVDMSTMFHYSMMPTQQYRQRFGLLNVSCGAAPSFSLHSADSSSEFRSSPSIWSEGRSHAIPAAVLMAGRLRLTGVIHDIADNVWLWRRYLSTDWEGDTPHRDLIAELHWPEETGGRATLEGIVEAVFSDDAKDEARDRMRALIEPERRRLRGEMRKCVERMLDVIFGPAPRSQPQLRDICSRQLDREAQSGYDEKIGMVAVGAAAACLEAVEENVDRFAYIGAIADALFDLLTRFERRVSDGEYSTYASSLGSLIRRIQSEMGEHDPAWIDVFEARWEARELSDPMEEIIDDAFLASLDVEAAQADAPEQTLEPVPEKPRRMSLAEYRALFQHCKAPSAQQIEKFVEFLRGKHSWYKRLPLTPPGAAFLIYLDPNAGELVELRTDGSITHSPITDEIDYGLRPWPTTDTYRTAYAQLKSVDREAPTFRNYEEQGVACFACSPRLMSGETALPLPEAVVEQGVVAVTGLIHLGALQPWLWEKYLRVDDPESDPRCNGETMFFARYSDQLDWPPECGGRAMLEAIRSVLDHPGNDSRRATLASLLTPEHRRQVNGLAAACWRAVAVAYGPQWQRDFLLDAIDNYASELRDKNNVTEERVRQAIADARARIHGVTLNADQLYAWNELFDVLFAWAESLQVSAGDGADSTASEAARAVLWHLLDTHRRFELAENKALGDRYAQSFYFRPQ